METPEKPEEEKDVHQQAAEEEKEFDDGYAEFSEDKAPEPPEEEEEPDSETDSPASGQDPEKPEDTPADQPPEEETPEDVQRRKSWEGRLKAEEERIKAEKEALERQRQEWEASREKPPESKEDEDKKPEEDALELSFDFENDEDMAEFRKEFPEIAAGMQTMVTKAFQQGQKSIIDRATKTVDERVAPLTKKAQEEADAVHFRTINDAHPDFGKKYVESGKLREWIESRPAYLRSGLMRVAKQGTAEEVIEMFNDMTKDLGITTPPPGPGRNKDREEAAAAVHSRGGGRPSADRTSGPDKNNFDDSYAEFAEAD